MTAFSFEPLFMLLAAIAGIVYLRALKHRPGETWHPLAFFGGLLIIVIALNSPLETLATRYLLIAHLLQNALIADWAPALLVIGLTPGMRDVIAARVPLPRPALCLVIWLATWYGLHAAGIYNYALRHPILLNAEHLLFITAGLLFWWPVLTRRISAPGALGYLGAAFVLANFLGLALTFISTPLYDFYAQAPRRYGFSAVRDQNLAGVLMNIEQSIVFVAAIGWVFFRMLGGSDETEVSGRARAVIFDCDGVIVDSESLCWRAWHEVLARFGVVLSDAEVANLYGHSNARIFEAIADRAAFPEARVVLAEVTDSERALYSSELTTFDDARALITALSARGIPLAVATNGTQSHVELMLERAGVRDAFVTVVNVDDVPNGKPAPDVYLEAARRLGVDPHECIAIEDSPVGARAAIAAGMQVTVVLRGSLTADAFPAEVRTVHALALADLAILAS